MITECLLRQHFGYASSVNLTQKPLLTIPTNQIQISLAPDVSLARRAGILDLVFLGWGRSCGSSR